MLMRFSPGTGLGAALVRFGTWSDYAHVALALGGGWVIDATPQFGVAEHKVEDDPGTEYRCIELPEAVVEEAYRWMRTQIGKPYDWTAIYGLALRRDWHEDSKWFCSEYQHDAFWVQNRPLIYGEHLDRVAPSHLRLSPRMFRAHPTAVAKFLRPAGFRVAIPGGAR